ncbi:MAG: phosphoglycolate phosphatase [Proteobacteria bacterium]|nr:phosphoglycolate phosphatase [Pseudomonadota bacterium]
MSAAPAIAAVLFDLDGTLIDSAPDLAGAGNDMRAARGLPRLPLEHFRPMVGAGARGMVGRAFDVAPGDPAFAELRDEFLARYEARMLQETRVFPEMVAVIDRLDAHAVRWGIVTNKATRYAEPLVRALGLAPRVAALIAGDTTPHAKPHPAPLLEGARRIGVAPEACVYVGDDLRDAQAGRAAGMRTVAAAWGYLGLGEAIDAWGADHIVATPADLLNWLALA